VIPGNSNRSGLKLAQLDAAVRIDLRLPQFLAFNRGSRQLGSNPVGAQSKGPGAACDSVGSVKQSIAVIRTRPSALRSRESLPKYRVAFELNFQTGRKCPGA